MMVRICAVNHGDCIAGMKLLRPRSVSMVFADLPYGRTQNDWDRCVPMSSLWEQIRRVCKPDAAIVFTAMQPFTSLLVMSNPKWYRYSMVWRKNKPRGFLNAKKQPLRVHEDILVFYEQQPPYRPQMTSGHRPVNGYTKHSSDGTNYGATKRGVAGGGSTLRYPVSVLDIPVLNNDDPERCHPTQKPEALPRWFIETYTNPGDLVLDPTAGSGSTLLAAKSFGRRFVGFETNAKLVRLANRRLANREVG